MGVASMAGVTVKTRKSWLRYGRLLWSPFRLAKYGSAPAINSNCIEAWEPLIWPEEVFIETDKSKVVSPFAGKCGSKALSRRRSRSEERRVGKECRCRWSP